MSNTPIFTSNCAVTSLTQRRTICSLSVHLLTPMIVLALPGLALTADYDLLIDAPVRIVGTPGDEVYFTATVQLAQNLTADPVEGWSLGVAAENCTIIDATTQQTVGASIRDIPPGLLDTGFENTFLTSGPGNEGAVSLIVLSLTKPVTLDPATGPHDLLKLNVQATVPDEGWSICMLHIRDGLQDAMSRPFSNVLTVNGASRYPNLRQTEVFICSDAENLDTLLVGHWKLDEKGGTVAADYTGHGNHGAVYGNPVWQPAGGKIKGTLELDGFDDYIDAGNDTHFNITSEITLAAWVNTSDAGNSEHNPYITKGDYTYGLKHRVGNNLEFFIFDAGNWRTVHYPVNASFNGDWHHLAGTYDGSALKLYIDGMLKNTTSYVGGIATSAAHVNIGRNSEAIDRFYHGSIDDVRIYYNYALSDAEILKLSCFPPITSDFDGNCRVDFADFAFFVSEWLECNRANQADCWN